MLNLPISPTLSAAKQAWRVNDFCKDFGLSRSTVYLLMKDGRLKTVKIAGRRLIPAAAAAALLTGEG